MRHTHGWWIGWLLGVVLLGGAPHAALAEEPTMDPYVRGALGKLGRGIANVVTCPLEVIRTSTMVTARDGFLSGISSGLLEGVGRTVLRGIAGVYEIATFPLEIPPGFRPLIEPEFAFAQGSWVNR